MTPAELRGRCVLHVIAHPDDEHAGALTFLARIAGARVHVFSLTRGECGANVCGPETGADLGLLRTAELAAACRIYGVESLHFGSAPDYGFSRRLDECWDRWDRRALLAELALCIRQLRPAVIASRFWGGPGDGHAHHQAAGLLCREAFRAAGDPAVATALPPHQAAALWLGQVPAGERVDVEIDAQVELAAGGSCLELAERGYLCHRSQDPAQLLAHAVDHAVARYQLIEAGAPAELPAPRRRTSHAAEPPEPASASHAAEPPEPASASHAAEPPEPASASHADGPPAAASTSHGAEPPAARFDARGPIDLRGLELAEPIAVDDGGAPLATLPLVAITQPPLLVTDAAGCDRRVTFESRAPDPVAATVFRRGPAGDGPERALTLVPGEAVTVELALPDGLGPRAELTTVARAGLDELGARLLELDTPLGPITAVRPARALAVRAGARVLPGVRVAVFPGPDPALPRALAQLGIATAPVDTARWPQVDWGTAQVAFVDARAYAVTPALRADSSPLCAFANAGGHVVVCHQTPEYDPARHAPYPGTLPVDADEACEEDEPARLLAPEHPLLSAPNRITAADFDGWHESRGSKFWSHWAPEYQPLLELCDRGRPPARGVYLTAAVGRGRYTYCALALGRQVAAGVPGGFRLLANLVSPR